ncbi:MAG: dienelactone hydrolase family protein [Ktedonobacterales bacterium]|nr:dienelactone hydrolase family protein [Ktedonobacterales bacterium]
MCFDVNAEPPMPPISGGEVRGEELVLTSMDGTKFSAFAAHGVSELIPSRSGIVILPDVRGLYRFYRDLALRFASAGIEAVAIDYFGRTAGLTPREDDFDFWPHVQQTQPETVAADVASAVAYLRQTPSASQRAIFTVGFCFGGGNSFLQAANRLGLAGVIGFYGSPRARQEGAKGPIDHVSEFACPVLGLFGGADQGIPVDSVHEFDAALAAAGVAHEIVIYPDAPHSFFDRKQEEYTKESTDAWQRMLDFIQRYTPGA